MSKFKECPYCGEEILAKAIKCKHCHSMLEEKKPAVETVPEKAAAPSDKGSPPPLPPVDHSISKGAAVPPPPPSAVRSVPPPPPPVGRGTSSPPPPSPSIAGRPAAPPPPPSAGRAVPPPPPSAGRAAPPPPPAGYDQQKTAGYGMAAHSSGTAPFAPLSSFAASEVSAGAYNYPKAGLGKRALAYIIDMLIASIVLIFTAPVAFIPFYSYLGSSGGLRLGGSQLLLMVLSLIVGCGWALYYSLLRDSFGRGQSIGKKAVGLMVVRLDNNLPCTKRDSFLRNVVALGFGVIFAWIPGLNFLAGFVEPLIAIFHAKGMRLGDRLAKTQVIAAADYRQ